MKSKVRDVALTILAAVALADQPAAAQECLPLFDPTELTTLYIDFVNPQDWDVVRKDTTNSIEVPAWFRADVDPAWILTSVRRKSSRALPSEGNPQKVGLKIDINEYRDQIWHGVIKVSLENGVDTDVVAEGLAWNLHRFAAGPEGYGYVAPTGALAYSPACASWVRLYVNGEYKGVYVNAEQRDKQFLKNRKIYTKDATWFYDQGDIGGLEVEVGVSSGLDSPAVQHLTYSPFQSSGKKNGTCSVSSDAALEADLNDWINMRGMLALGAVDAFIDNPDSLISHGKNDFFADFAPGQASLGSRTRMYFPWDLDAIFRSVDANIYANRSGKNLTQSAYQCVILNNPAFRALYNQIFLDLFDGLDGPVGAPGPFDELALHTFLYNVEVVLTAALETDPYPTVTGGVAGHFQKLRDWISIRIRKVREQILANYPSPRTP